MKKIAMIAMAGFGLCAGSARGALLAYFPFTGGAITDFSGNGVASSGIGGITVAPGGGYYGDGMSFDGVDDAIRVELNINPSALPALTMGAWVKSSNVSPIKQVISHDDANFDRSIGYDTRGGGGTTWSAFNGTGVVSSGAGVNRDEWVFLAAVYDNVAGTLRFHVNGTVTTSPTNFNPGWTYTLIGDNPSFSENFAGVIDEVFFFDEALTDGQIETIRRTGIPEPTALGLLAPAGLLLGRRRR